MVLYHVTPGRNLPSILRSGLQVAGSHKGRPVVWLCDRRHLLWTLGHVARWKQRDPASMRIVSVEYEPGAFTGVRPGTYLSWTSIPAARIVACAIHSRVVLEPVVEFIAWHVERGLSLAEATERARRDERFTGVAPAIFNQAARFASRLSQPSLRRVTLPTQAEATARITRPCTPVALSRARQWQSP